MTENRFSIEYALYASALILALGIRLLSLGAGPLSDFEATHALRALDVARSNDLDTIVGDDETLDPQPAYFALTGLTFYLFGGSNFLARIWPALIGGSMALVPYFFRNPLGRIAALILAFALALNPGMVAISRVAGGQMLALGFSLWALVFAYARKPVWFGIFTGLALLSGPTALHGFLGLALAWGTAKLMGDYGIIASRQEKEIETVQATPSKGALRIWFLSCSATILIVGSIFLIFPQGLSIWVATIPAYIKGWIEPSRVPALRLLASLVIYQPLALIFGLFGAVRGWIRGIRMSQLLSLWLAFAFGIALLYPARQVGDLVWVLLPLWTLAALELARSFDWESEGGLVSIGQALLIFLLLALFWINLSRLGAEVSSAQSPALRLGVLGGVLALTVLITALVAFGWSWKIARRGLIWGLSVALGIYGLANMWSASQLHYKGNVELWNPYPTTLNADLLIKTIEDLSEWNTGMTDNIDITVAVKASSLRWALIDFSRASFVPERQLLAISGEPSIVIAHQVQEAPSLAASYRGQDFAWWSYPGWLSALPPDFFNWLVFRKAPVQQEQLILWARADLFPEGFSESEGDAPSLPEDIIPEGNENSE